MASLNAFKRLKELLPDPVLRIGTVLAVDNGVATIEEPGGVLATARGVASPGDRVYFRNDLIEGEAPDLPLEDIEV